MHELSIAMSIIEISEKNAIENNATKISSLTLQVGKLSGIVMEALETAMISAKKNTMLHDAQINYDLILGKSKCEECGNEFDTEDIYTLCPKCNSFKTTIIQGKELHLASIDIE